MTTTITATYPGAEGTESHVAKIDAGYSASLWDTDAGEMVGCVIYRSDRFPDAKARADAKALEMVSRR